MEDADTSYSVAVQGKATEVTDPSHRAITNAP